MTNFDAVIFDLDGVITRTAHVHAEAWKRMFDTYLLSREKRYGETFREFTMNGDYLPYVDGKPRYKGVESFLESRGIDIPFGDPSDDNDSETVCGLGNLKNSMFNSVLDEKGAEVFDTSVSLIHELKSAGVKIGVASSSKNCKPVLEKVGLLDLFATRIDGVVSAELGLMGKPEADIFTTACDRLDAKYSRSVVVEDAVSGVQAGRKGNFGLVIGVAREDNADELLANGADIVVEDLGEISVSRISEWFEKGIEKDSWILTYHGYDPGKEKSREALLSVGNGYSGTRGALGYSKPNSVNYPGTYISGLFNRLTSKVAGREIENEDLVNIINWLPITFRIEDGEWLKFDPEPSHRLVSIRRDLDMKSGELTCEIVTEDGSGRLTRVRSSRFASMADPHRAGIRFTLEPLNYSGTVTIRSELRGDHINAGVERYSDLEQEHLEPVSSETSGNRIYLLVKTVESGIEIAAGAYHSLSDATVNRKYEDKGEEGWVSCEFRLKAKEGKQLWLEKMVSIYTGMDDVGMQPLHAVKTDKEPDESYKSALDKSRRLWGALWDKAGITIQGDREAQKIIRLHTYHILSTASIHYRDLDTGIPPRGLTGEAYRGHIFWDELYILPFFNLHLPEVTKTALVYRYKRLGEARKNAIEHGYRGAMFPWQSGSSGREETQVVHLNPLSGEWGEDYSSLQRHVSLAIAYNLCNYYSVTGDTDFMVKYGAELLYDICRFWSSKAVFDKGTGRYHIDRVMGPDEYHEKLPGNDKGGVTDNAYTNIMVSWMMEKAIQLEDRLPSGIAREVLSRIDIDDTELKRWKDVRKGLALNISDEGIVEQFKGYFGLAELDWDHYREKYDDIHRLDRILKAEGKSPDEFKLAKQADFLMTFYNLGEEEVRRIINSMGYKLPDDFFRRNFDYYLAHTSHGSTLSRLVHSALAFRLGLNEEGWKLYLESLRSDLDDIQGGTTGEGIHCGVMAGTIYMVISVFFGADFSGDILSLCPRIPANWEKVNLNFTFRSAVYNLAADHKNMEISANGYGKEKIKVNICGRSAELETDRTHTTDIN